MLLLLALLVLASLGQHGARAAATWETLGAKTFSGALLPTVAEWRESFRSEHSRHGLVHVWLRCLQGGPNAEPWVRAYFYVETSEAVETSVNSRWELINVPPKQFGWMSDWTLDQRFWLTFDGAKADVYWHGYSGGHALWNASAARRAALAGTGQDASVRVGVHGWSRWLSFPLRLCEAADPPRAQGRAVVLSVNTYFTSDAVFVAAALRHALYHRCALDLASYEVLVTEADVPAWLADPGIRRLVESGFVRLLRKPPMPADVTGAEIAWQGIYENLVLLTRWGQQVTVLFWDPDEFLAIHNRTALLAALASAPVVSFPRVNAAHFAATNAPDVCAPFGGADFFAVRTKEPPFPKVALQPDGAALAYVHFAQGRSVNVSRADATLVHFVDFYRRRNSDARKGAVLPAVKLLESCDTAAREPVDACIAPG